MRKRSDASTGSSTTGTVVVVDVVVVTIVEPPDDSVGGSGGGSTMFGELRSPYDAAWTGSPSMLTATPKAKSPAPSRRSCRYSSNRAHCASVGGTSRLLGVGRATSVVVAAVTAVAGGVAEPLAGVDGAALAVGDGGFVSVLAAARDVVGVAASGREEAHAAAPAVTSRAATTDTWRCVLAEIMGHHLRGRSRQLRLAPDVPQGDRTARAMMSVPKAVRIAR